MQRMAHLSPRNPPTLVNNQPVSPRVRNHRGDSGRASGRGLGSGGGISKKEANTHKQKIKLEIYFSNAGENVSALLPRKKFKAPDPV